MRTWLVCRPPWGIWIVYPTFVAAWVNFAVLLLGSIYLGGDAFNGYVVGTHHFLCFHKGGPCREVSESIYRFSYWQTVAAIVSILLAGLESVVFRVGKRPHGGSTA